MAREGRLNAVGQPEDLLLYETTAEADGSSHVYF